MRKLIAVFILSAVAQPVMAGVISYSYLGTSTIQAPFNTGILQGYFALDSSSITPVPGAIAGTFNTSSIISSSFKYSGYGQSGLPPQNTGYPPFLFGTVNGGQIVSADPVTGDFTPFDTAQLGISNIGYAKTYGAQNPGWFAFGQFSNDSGNGSWVISSPSNPVLPSSVGGPGQFVFSNVVSGAWYDPPSAGSFDYQMTAPGSLFTGITLPTGFSGPFTISSGGSVLGTANPGQAFSFGAGVPEFLISGINPLVDPTNTSAFPLLTFFNTPTATFTMSAVPEPSTLTLLVATAGFAAVGANVRRRIAGRRGRRVCHK
jgi:PEP-CTERM motif